MVLGWRRAFCTSIPKNPEKDHHHQHQTPRSAENAKPSPSIRSKFGFFSNPSTPRLRSHPVSGVGTGSGLGCRSASATAATPTCTLPNSPRLKCRTTSNATPRKSTSPRLFSSFSNSSSSPTSPLFKASLLLNKSSSIRCGVCLQSVKTGQGTAIFTAECSHVFHFPCVARLTSKRCPVCLSAWGDAPSRHLPSVVNSVGPDPNRRHEHGSKIREVKTGKSLRVYNDDEPLASSPVSLALFNTIPESDENDDVEDDDEFPGFFANTTSSSLSSKLADTPISKNLEVKLQPESAIVAAGRRSETYAVVMKVKAPPGTAARGARRPSVDLVTVLDLGGGVKLQTVKNAMRLVISLLRETDRLSIVVFSSGSKRLLPFRRMTAEGRRIARRIVDALAGGSTGVGMSVSDALKKAVKVVEDRRETSPPASILVLSDGQNNPAILKAQFSPTRLPFFVSTTRFSDLRIPVHSVWFASAGALDHSPLQDAFTERIAALLNVVMNDVRLQLGLVAGSGPSEITSVYSLTGRPESFGSGSVHVGDLFPEEERELLVELKAPISSIRSHLVMSVRSSIVDPTTAQPISSKERRLLIPRPQAVRSSSPSIERLRNLHVVIRAVAESRRLIQREDLAGAYRLLTSARSTVAQANFGSADDSLRGLEMELAELSHLRMRNCSVAQAEEKAEPITPTSAWRAAERLAKVAMMRKHLTRVSDLHGLEDARF